MTDRSEMFQVRARWRLAPSPPEAGSSPERARERDEHAVRLATTTPGAPAAFAWPALPEPDAETFAAVETWQRDKLLAYWTPSGLSFDSVPLLLDHAVLVIADLDVAINGTDLTAVGWVPSPFASALRTRPHVSHGLYVVGAHIEAFGGLRFLSVDRCVLTEVSAVADPLIDGTSLFVGHRPGITYWSSPEGERFTRNDPDDRVRFAKTLDPSPFPYPVQPRSRCVRVGNLVKSSEASDQPYPLLGHGERYSPPRRLQHSNPRAVRGRGREKFRGVSLPIPAASVPHTHRGPSHAGP
jgi:hypothetical protein